MSNLDRKRVLENDVIQQLCSETSTADPIREAFLKRLQTFDVLSWNGKPINPPQCAQHGWEFAEENILKCSTCQSYLSVELPSPSQRKSYIEACTQLKSHLVTKHSKFCLFVLNPISEQVCQISHLTKANLLSSIIENASAFNQLAINFKFPKLKEVEEVFDWMVENSKLVLDHKIGFIFSLTGWTCVKENQLGKCNYCNRRWLLEEFVSDISAVEAENVDKVECSSIDPIIQHQCWCAWRHPDMGWQVQLKKLQQIRDAHESPKRTRLHTSDYASLSDGMRNIRKMLNGTP